MVVVGQICADLIPALPAHQGRLEALLTPGHLLEVGPMVISTGGGAANTGLALQRLGTPVRLLGKVGGDTLGRVILELLTRHAPDLGDTIVVAPEAQSSYTVILSAPGVDRTFLHYPGPNTTLCAADVPDGLLQCARVLHVGYPPLLNCMARNAGAELELLFRRARSLGVVTSLDMTMPDPAAETGAIAWPAFYARVLPWVDLFLPNIEETLFTLDRQLYTSLEAHSAGAGLLEQVDGDLLTAVSTRLLDLGAGVVGLKLGAQGMALRTTNDRRHLSRLESALSLPRRIWRNRELLAPAFQATLVGTTGAGDCAVAGFLSGILRGRSPEDTLTAAVATGSCNVEAADAISGVPSWDKVWERVNAGWQRIPTTLALRGWGWDESRGLWIGPSDRGGQLAA